MTVQYPTIVLLLSISLGSFAVPRGGTQSPAECAQAFDHGERTTRSFVAEAERNGLTFVAGDVANTAWTGLKQGSQVVGVTGTTMTGVNRTAAAVKAADYAESAKNFAKAMSDYRRSLADLERCLESKTCKLIDFVKEQNRELAEWILSLAGGRTEAATGRVSKALELLSGYVSRLGLTFQDNATTALDSCLNQITHAEAASNGSSGAPGGTRNAPADGTPVDANAAPPEPTKPDGGSVTPWLVGGALTAGGLYGLKYWQDHQAVDASCGARPSITPPPGQSRPTNAQLDALEAWCSCQKLGFGNGPNGFGCLTR